MTLLLYLFALFTSTDRIVCDLWTLAITRDGMVSACGTDQLSERYRVDVYSLDMSLLCTRPIASLNNVLAECALDGRHDQYILRIVERIERQLLCVVESEHKDNPTVDEIAAQCPQSAGVNYSVEFASVKEPEPAAFTCPIRALHRGDGLYDQATSAADLATDAKLSWLAGKLIWGGLVRHECNGSGLDPYTLAADACGMTAAQGMVTAWQNQFDAEIFAAAQSADVPAKLLKKILLTESQMWPFYSADHSRAGEISVMQITDNGFDTLLRFDPALDVDYLKRDDAGKYYSRAAVRDTLVCVNCNMEVSINQIKKSMDIYARLLAAFQCRAVTINPALSGNDTWRQAVVDYNGSAEYLSKIEQ